MRVGTQNKTTDPRFCATTALSHCPYCFTAPCFLRHQRKAYCYYCCYSDLPPVDIIFSCPDTITLITVAKTLIIAIPGCPSDSPPPESSWVCDSPPFSSLQPQLRELILQSAPKTRVSAPPGVSSHCQVMGRVLTRVPSMYQLINTQDNSSSYGVP